MSIVEQQLRKHVLASLIGTALLSCCIFPAAADDGKPRYVSGTGRDQGDCLNRFRPCRTLSYAIAQAGKGDSIQVAEGTYTINQSAQLFDLLSVTGRVNAGFSKYSGYSERNAREATTLVGVPPEFRERFEAAGFAVIVDSKGIDADETRRMRKLTAQVSQSEKSHAAAPCIGNVSAGFPCTSVSLLSHLAFDVLKPTSTRANDIWGYTDLNTGREYAFIGVENGVAILDVTDPVAPEQVGAPTGSSTTWRDVEIYQVFDATAQRWRAYAYVTADNVQDVLMVLDLSGLPNGVERVEHASDHRAAHTNYMLDADFTYGISQTGAPPVLGIAGANLNGGNHRLYSLSNPRAPALLSVSSSGYAHDLVSFPIRDARKNTQCVNAQTQPQCQVLADFNENTVDIWDVTDPASRQLLFSRDYTNWRFTHSGWWTEDGVTCTSTTSSTSAISVSTRRSACSTWRTCARRPRLDRGSGPTRAIDHNSYVKGNRLYFSNYSEGLTILDITNPVAPVRVGQFDTFPATSEVGFVGAWGVYPFFASGTIAISDINSGLYLVRNETLATPRGALSIASAKLSGTEGQSLAINVNRSAGTGAVSVRLDVLYATANASDATLASSTLSWADGDAQPKSTTLDLASDAPGRRPRSADGPARRAARRCEHRLSRYGAGHDRRHRKGQPPARARCRTCRGRGARQGIRNAHAARLRKRRSARELPDVAGGTYTGATATQGDLVWPDGDVSAKTITVALNPATLTGSQNGTLQMEIFNATNASLETAAGASVPVLPVTVTVRDLAEAVVVLTPTPTPSQPRSGVAVAARACCCCSRSALLLISSRFPAASARAARSSGSAAGS